VRNWLGNAGLRPAILARAGAGFTLRRPPKNQQNRVFSSPSGVAWLLQSRLPGATAAGFSGEMWSV
jgi:hypothetical protein